MKIISDSTPLIDGYHMPAEFSPHSGCIIIFPERPDSWQYGGVKAKKAFCEVACAIAKSEKVTVLASFEQYENARRMLPLISVLSRCPLTMRGQEMFPPSLS